MGGTWVPVPSICDRKLPVCIWVLQGYLVKQLDRQRESQSDSYLPLGWLVHPGVWWSWHVTCGVSQPGRLLGSQHPWWLELAKIPGVDNHQELAWNVWASFKIPQWISEWHGMENYHQAPLALLCICQKDFLPQPDPKFAFKDIRELQLEKTVAYAQALQFWVEKLICLLRANRTFWWGAS